jgi:hypothetical protein
MGTDSVTTSAIADANVTGVKLAADIDITTTGYITVESLTVNGQSVTPRYATTVTVDWDNGNVQSITLGNGNNNITFINGKDGGKYILILKQPAGGAAGMVSWDSAPRWPSGTAPTLTTTNSKTDYVGFIYNGVDSKYDGVAFSSNL